MAQMTQEQQQAIALATARLRLQQQQGQAQSGPAKGAETSWRDYFGAPSYPIAPTGGEVAQDQAANVLKGIPQAVTGIPAALKSLGNLLIANLSGRYAEGGKILGEMASGMAAPFQTVARGAGALAAPMSVNAPSEQDWQQAAQAGGAFLGGAELPNALAGIGKAAGPMASATAKAVIPESLPPRLYESALKPGPRSNTLPEIQRMVQTGLEQGIPVTEGGVGKVNTLVDALNKHIQSKIESSPAMVNKFDVASRLSELAKSMSRQVNPEADLATISRSGNEFLRNQPAMITAPEAQALKQGTYKSLGNKAYGELKGADIEAQKALARGLKEELANAIPEIRQLNLTESQLLELRPELEAAVNRIRNREMFGIGTPIFGGAAAAATGSPAVGIMSGVARSLIDRPGFKSKLAIALKKARD